MRSDDQLHIGDWIKFFFQGQQVIGEVVQMTTKHDITTVHTSAGFVRKENIIERRPGGVK